LTFFKSLKSMNGPFFSDLLMKVIKNAPCAVVQTYRKHSAKSNVPFRNTHINSIQFQNLDRFGHHCKNKYHPFEAAFVELIVLRLSVLADFTTRDDVDV